MSLYSFPALYDPLEAGPAGKPASWWTVGWSEELGSFWAGLRADDLADDEPPGVAFAAASIEELQDRMEAEEPDVRIPADVLRGLLADQLRMSA